MTVVQRGTRRRWLLVLAGAAVLGALPVAVSARPTTAPKLAADAFRERIRRSAGRPHQGYAESVGALGLPVLPRFDQISSLLSGTTRMRAWYAARDRWRVDVVDTGNERGFYQTPDGQYFWDYGANRLTHVAPPRRLPIYSAQDETGGLVVAGFVEEAPVRLPRAADLMPPDLARRLLGMAADDRVRPVAGRRVAGIAAAGLRITPTDPHSTIGHIDIWADPATGLPLQVQVSGRGAERPVLVTRFLDVAATAPGTDALTPPARRDGMGFTHTDASDVYDALFDQSGFVELPERLGGLPRRDPLAGPEARLPGDDRKVLVASLFNSIAVYGTGLAQVAVLPLSRRAGREVYRTAAAWGQRLTLPTGTAALLSSSLLSVMVVDPTATAHNYLLAGMVDGELLRRVGTELSGIEQ